MASKERIVVGDSQEKAVRVQVEHTRYYRASNNGGTVICFGGDSDNHLLVTVREDPAAAEAFVLA